MTCFIICKFIFSEYYGDCCKSDSANKTNLRLKTNSKKKYIQMNK